MLTLCDSRLKPLGMTLRPIPLSSDLILDTATGLVRRFGEAKTNMVDIARALGVSHAALYRFYSSKASVMDAITEVAMEDEAQLAAAHLEAEGSAAARLLAMLLDLQARKRERFTTDREIHELYRRIMTERPDVIMAYAARMTALVERLVQQAIDRGEWRIDDAAVAAGVIRDAVTVYIHPMFVAQSIAAGFPVEQHLRATVETLTRAFAAGLHYRAQP